MTKTRQWKWALIALCAVLIVSLAAVGLSALVHDRARAEEISITIYNKGNGDVYSAESSGRSESRYRSGNGSVTYNGETITADDAKNTPDKVITANITEEGLQVKAEAQQDSLFFCWATDAEAKNIVSMRSEDTFTYEEVQSFQSKGLYAFFVPILGEELRAAVQFKITYNDTLGDVYLFLGKENVENETLQKHGLPIPSGQLIDIPFYQCEVWSISSEPATLSNTSRGASNLTFAAIPKTEIDSTIDLSRKTSAVFKEWSATYGVYAMNGNQLLSQENRPLPEICDTANSSSSIDPDGSKQYFPDLHTPVDETWSCPSISFRSDRPPVDGISFNPEILYGDSTTKWLINPFNNKEESNATITVLPQTISAEFQEVAIVPEIEVTPYVNDEMKDPITFDRDSTEHITFYYGQKNSINAIFVNSDQLVKQPEYQVTQTLLDGTTGKYTSKTIPVTQVMGTVSGFNISEIDNSCTITIIPNYGEEYYIDTFTIAIDLVTEKGFEDIVSKESEAVTVVSGDDWYFNPQLTANGVYTFTSGISYQVDLSEKNDSQLHFQVKGSGVFTFEFYLDGAGIESYMSPAYAVYGTGSQINKNGITSGSFGDNTTALAKGNTVVGSLTDIHYYPCTILAVDKVTRIDDVTDWCRASIAVTAENYDTVTDIYVAHIASPYNSEYGSIFGPHTAMSVRNVAYYQGHSNVSWDIYDNAKGDKSDWGIISAQSGGKEASQTDLTSGTMIDFSISYNEDNYKFYGWSDGAELLSTEKEFSYTVKGKTDGSSKTKICAVLAPTNQPYSYRTGGEFYDENSLEDALTMAAERSANVYVLRSVEITKSVTIAPNVNLVIPFDGTNRLHGSADEKDDVQEKISWLVAGDTFKYLTVTVAGNVTLTVQGGLYLGGVVNYPSQTYQGHTSGAYSEIVNDGKIIIDNGGIMDVYGHVTGNGSIEVNKNAKLYEPFLILDYAGGTNTLGIFSAGQTPFKRYAMINIECPMTINYGGMLYGHATLYALSAFFSLDQPFVSYDMGSDMGGDGFGHDTIIMLTEGASVTITYNSKKVVHSEVATNCTEGIGQTKLVFDGGAIFSYMLFSAMGLEIPTNSVYFSIPYNFEVEMNGKDAVYETKTDFMIMPGATVKVGTGATLTLNANAWIFDGMVQGVLDGKSYPKANELENAGYSKNGNLIVDGTLRIGQKTTVEGFDFGSLFGGSGSSSFVPQKIPATFLGVVQTNGTGKIEIPEKTILQATIIDGIENRTYFSYTTTTRVWDAAHSCFGELVAGHTYTATSGDTFTLDSLKYTTTKGGAEDKTLQLNETLHGSWMVDHGGEHVFDWTPVDGDALGDSKYKQLTRQCTELGCNHTTHKDLFAELSDLGNATYKGSAFTQEDILAQLTTLFGIDGSAEEMFEITMPTIENANTYQITLKLVNGFWLKGEQYDATDRTWNFTVDPQNIDDAKVTVTAPQDVVFNNQTQQLEPTLQFNGGELTKDTDYSLSFAGDTTNAGTVTITIVGQNNFTGSKQVTYQITALTLSDDSLTLGGVNKSYEYNAQSQKPNPSSVLVSGIALSDYDIAYRSADDDNCVNVGTVTITVTPRETNKNFTGSATFTFEITAKNASGAQVTVNGEYDYTGYAQQPADQVEVKLDGFEMTANDYDVVFDSNIEPGEANVTVNFKGNFSGTAKGKFTISKRDVSKLTVEGIESSYEFAGHKIQPQITVKNGETRLDITTDYTVQYGDNTNVGSGTVTVTGAGKHFEGTKQFTFDITPKDASQAEVTVSGSYVYNAQQHDVKVSIQLEGYSFETSDYTIVYAEGADRTNAGAVSFSVQFNGNFTGTVADKSFTIDKANVKVTPQNAESPEGENQAQLSYTISGTMYGTDQQTLEDALSVKIENDADVSKGSAGDTFNIVVVYDNVAQLDKNYNIDVSAKGTYTITEAVFKDVKFNDSTVDYDGAAHGIEATSLPDQAKASYEYKVQGGDKLDSQPKNAGKYDVTVTVTLENYKPLVLTRTLTINAKKVQVNVLDQTVTYNGKPQQAQNDAAYYAVPEGAIVNDDEVVFALSSDQITDVGSREIKLTVSGSAMGNYDIAYNTAQFNVQALAIAQEGVQVTSEHVFNGKVQTPTLSVTAEGITLNAQQDYDVTYQDGRINAGDYTVTVQAKGNFSGSVTVSFNIAQAKLTNVNATGNSVYDGNDKTPVLVVGAEGGLTVDSGDYSVAYTGSRTNVGKFTIEVTATGSNYTGTVSTQFEVTPAHLDSVKNIGEYTFNRQEQKPLLEAKAGSLTLAESDYDISVQSGSLTNAGSALLKVTAKGNFEGTQTVSVTIKPATVDSVEVTGTYEYNGQQQTPQLVVKAGSLVLETTEYRLSLEGNSTNSGTVQFSVQGTGNFDGSRSGSFEIQRKKVQVTVNDGESTYGDSYQALTFSHEGLIKETDLIMSNYVSLSCSALQEECAAADTYDIVANVTQPENNYTLEVVRQGHYTVHKRDISVTVNNQSDVYGFGKDYDFDFNKWQVTEGNLLEGDVLLELVKPQFGNAGDYVIDVTSVNPNYNVTVTKGTYTISKLRVEHDNNNVIINLMVDGETVDETKLYQYAGEDFVLTGQAFVYEGDEYSPLQTSLSAETLSEVGVYDVTVTIVDDNYEGSRTFHVEVVGADGYSKNLHDVLAELERIVGDKNADTLTSSQEDFALVKQVIAEMDKLSESEKELGADELTKYLELVDTWHDAADIDDNVIETAKVLAEAPLKWLFAAAALDALLAALYVFAKGGIL